MSGVASHRAPDGWRAHPQPLSVIHNTPRVRTDDCVTMKNSKVCEICRRKRPLSEVNAKSICCTCNSARGADSSNDYRRRRNQKNLMMINRLETNIERMESRLLELGFDLSQESGSGPSLQEEFETSQALAGWSVYENPANYTPTESEAGDASADPGQAQFTAPPDPPPVPTDYYLYGDVESIPPETLPCFHVPRGLAETHASGCFSALSPEGREWINAKVGEDCSPDLPSLHPFSDLGGHSTNPLYGVFSSAVFSPIPSQEETASLLKGFLDGFNTLCPLYQPSKLKALFNSSLDRSSQSPSRWATINIVLAFGYMFRPKKRGVAPLDDQKSWMFIKNALGVVNELYLGPPDLWAVQALLGMVIFLLSTSSTQPCIFLISTAMRISQQIGLERCENGRKLSKADLEERSRVFWIAYCLDRDVSLRFGKPPSQSDEDMNVGLPVEPPQDSPVLTAEQRYGFDAFRAACQLSMIKSQLYKRLYSVKAIDCPLDELITAVSMLDDELQRWKDTIPSQFRPETRSPTSMSPSLLYLHYSYFDCVISIHRLTASRARKMITLMNKGMHGMSSLPSNQRVHMSATLCARAARASIDLMKYMPEENACLVGYLIHYPIVASMTLSSCILRNPTETFWAHDMKLVAKVERFLASGLTSTPIETINRLVKFCAEYRMIAETALKGASAS